MKRFSAILFAILILCAALCGCAKKAPAAAISPPARAFVLAGRSLLPAVSAVLAGADCPVGYPIRG